MFSPEAFFPVLERLTRMLRDCQIRYQLTGGLVAVYYGDPRLTQDADLVVDPVQLRAQLEPFLRRLQTENYIAHPDTIRDAAARGKMFQVIDSVECLKVDLYPRELVAGALERSLVVDITPTLRMPIASRADIVASKLVWISLGSHKSRRDVRQLMRRATAVEAEQARQFANELKVEALLDEVLAEPDEIDA